MDAALNTVPGVQAVKIDYAGKTATVSVEDGFDDNAALIAALEEANFGGSVVE